MARNDLRVEIFTSGTTAVVDAADDFRRFQNMQFSTGYPGGLYLAAKMAVSRDIVKAWLLKGAQRLRILNGHQVVFEGQIESLERALLSDTQEILIYAVGYWGSLLASRRLRRLYADERTSADVWQERSGVDEVVETINIDRFDFENGTNQIKLLPQAGVNWGSADRIRIRYKAPAGETIHRMEFDCQFSEGSQVWTTKLQDVDDTEATLYSRTATGTDVNQSVEPAVGSTIIDMFLTSTNAQTSPANMDVFVDYRNIIVYAAKNHTPSSGKGTVDLTEITKDIRAEFSELSADEDLIASNTLALKPFIAPRYPTVADILSRASVYGDASQNRWATGIRGSHLASDALPLLFAEQYPALTGFDYAVRVDEPNLVPPFNITEGYIGSDENRVWNFIIVEFSDERGFSDWVTPDDDANLKDQTSIDDFGQRDYRLTIGHATQAVAVNAGRRFLTAHKDAAWSLRGPIAVQDFVRGAGGQQIPASEIQAGRRLKIENFLQDPATGADELIFLITKTDYVDDERVCNMTVGVPNSLDVYLAQRELVDERLLG
ncbi:hypothetical protein LCGC14_0401070 [marine sediment metagenome]|uniref:Uncharacterized protein n=1 Tax=marine sediment metagenome TaxID=412755 RepID=A0A0F9T2F5_9ZZZZ